MTGSMTQSKWLGVERTGHVATITFRNPPAHAWTVESLAALESIVRALAGDREIHTLILTGDGPKFFSAGADLKLFADADRALAREMARRFGAAFEAVSGFRGITIAAINGYAMGGGLECALACDFRVVESHAVMALPEAAVGLLPCAGGTQWLAWTIGESWAKRMILLGERVDADTALRIGLVDETVPSGGALARAHEMALAAERQSPTSIAACKALIRAARDGSPTAALVREREAFVDLFDAEDQREGVAAFLAKRKPEWVNG